MYLLRAIINRKTLHDDLSLRVFIICANNLFHFRLAVSAGIISVHSWINKISKSVLFCTLLTFFHVICDVPTKRDNRFVFCLYQLALFRWRPQLYKIFTCILDIIIAKQQSPLN